MENINSNRTLLIITTISCLYVTLSLACDPAAYRLVNIGGYAMGGSFFYAALYTLLDILTRVTGRKNVYILIFVFHICDLIFSYTLYFVSLLPLPVHYNYPGFNTVLSSLPRLFWSGIVGAIIAGMIEVTIYASLQKRINNFFLASGLSTLIIMLAHNVPTDYFAFKELYPQKVWQIVFMNFTVSILLLLIYTILGQFILKIINKYINLPKDNYLTNSRSSV